MSDQRIGTFTVCLTPATLPYGDAGGAGGTGALRPRERPSDDDGRAEWVLGPAVVVPQVSRG
jgi:hypothetical protein